MNNPAIEALLAYQQADEDGVMVLVSRQAIHEVVELVDKLEAFRSAVLGWREHDHRPGFCRVSAEYVADLGREAQEKAR